MIHIEFIIDINLFNNLIQFYFKAPAKILKNYIYINYYLRS